MSQRVYLIAKADRERKRESTRPYLIAGGGIAATAPAAGLAVRAGTGQEARRAQRDADSAKWLAAKYQPRPGQVVPVRPGLAMLNRHYRYNVAADKFGAEADQLRHASKIAARKTTRSGLLLGGTVAGGGTIGVVSRNAWRAHKDKKQGVGKAKDWKNISQYETERAQGRRAERHGGTVASLGATGALFGAELANADPDMFGTPFRMKRQLKALRVDRKARNTQTKEWSRLAGQLYDDPARHAAEMKRLRGVNRAATQGSLKQIARRNPASFVIAGGAGALGTGFGMMGYGRAKARNAEHQIANQRRERVPVTKARRNANLTNEELDRRLRRGSAVMKPLGAGAEANPIAGAVEGLLGSEKGFRARRNATYEEARGIQSHEQKRRAASLTGTAGALTAGSALKEEARNALKEMKNPKYWAGERDMTKIKGLLKKPRVLGGAAIAGASTIYSQKHKKRIGALEDQSWNRLVRENPRTKGN